MVAGVDATDFLAKCGAGTLRLIGEARVQTPLHQRECLRIVIRRRKVQIHELQRGFEIAGRAAA